MRIATLSNAAVIHTRRWVEHFRARGHSVAVWSLERGPEGLEARALPRASLPNFLRYPLAAGPLRRALAEFRPDLIDAHYVPNYGVIASLSGFRPISVAAWGSDLLVAARRDPLQRLRARFVLRRADLVIADGGNLARAAVELGAPAERVHAIPWGVDLARFARPEAREPELLLSTRMHEPVYDLPTLLAGVAPVLARRPGARLVVAGDGSRRASLERLAGRLLPSDRFRFVGLLEPETLAGWLARAAIYLSASRSDSTSLVSDIEGNREWVSEGEGARLFGPGNAAGVTRAVESVLDDPAWAERARAKNRRVIESRGDWSANMSRIESMFESLVRGYGPAGADRAGRRAPGGGAPDPEPGATR